MIKVSAEYIFLIVWMGCLLNVGIFLFAFGLRKKEYDITLLGGLITSLSILSYLYLFGFLTTIS